ncbi:MAG TPA: DUF6544 family protein [Gemmatimonadaceae bacterium]
MTADIASIERQLEIPPAAGTFSEAELDELPEPVRRYLRAAIAPGTPLAVSAHLRMHGRVKLGVWAPFRAQQTLSPHHGFVWRGRVMGVLGGSDHYLDRRGVSQWKIAGVFTVIHQAGPDTSRSSAGRCGIEAMWLPTVLLPRFGVNWSAPSKDHVIARHTVDDTAVDAHYRIDNDGLPTSVRIARWGDPNASGTFGWHPFGGEFTGHRSFNGVTIPHRGRFGWSFGTPQWHEGEFFRYEITALHLLR